LDTLSFPLLPVIERQDKQSSSYQISPSYTALLGPARSANYRHPSTGDAPAKTNKLQSLQSMLQSMDTALGDEIQEKQNPENTRRHAATNGRLLAEMDHRYIYLFDLENPWDFEDETPIVIEFGSPSGQTRKSTIVTSTGNTITIVTEALLPDDALQKVWIVDDSTYLLERLRERLKSNDEGTAFLGSKSFGFSPYIRGSSRSSIAFGTKFLPDVSQQQAIDQALGSEVTYIIGPPGTGKTSTLAAIAYAHLCAGRTILVAANTNIAVDNAIMRVVDICKDGKNERALRNLKSGQIIRYGPPQLVEQLKTVYSDVHMPSIVDRRSHMLNQRREALYKRINELTRQIDALIRELQEAQIGYQGISVQAEERMQQPNFLQEREREPLKHPTRHFLSLLFQKSKRSSSELEHDLSFVMAEREKEQRQLDEVEEQIVGIEGNVVGEACMIATTLAKIYMNSTLYERRFDVVVLDEVSMALPPAVLIAASHANRSVILIGDPQQLEPIVSAKTDNARKYLQKDIFTLGGISINTVGHSRNDKHNSVLLTEQARMHPCIASIVSRHVYEGTLKNSVRVQEEAKSQLYAGVQPLPGNPLILCDTGDGSPVATKPNGKSCINDYHAHCCIALARQILATLPERQVQKGEFRIGLVTPYARQAVKLQRLVKDAGLTNVIRAGTVHRFQGLEAEVVIFDTVESSPVKPKDFTAGSWGSSAMRLINVAVTRAKYKLIIVANYQYLCEHLPQHATLRLVVQDAYAAAYIRSGDVPSLSAFPRHSPSTLNRPQQTDNIFPGRESFYKQTARGTDASREWGEDILLHRNDFPEETTTICKKCGINLVLRQNGQTNKPFYGCPNYRRDDPDHTTANLIEKNFVDAVASVDEFANIVCKLCHKPLVLKVDRDYAWVECTNTQFCGYGRRIVYK
jgi:hypothetical protein